MAIYIGSQKPKFYLGDQKIKAIWLGGVKVYSAGNVVTYHVDIGVTYQEEVDEGASCLSPKSFTPAKSGWTFLGWRTDAGAYESVYNSLVMGDAPVTLYAVFTQSVVLSTYVSGSLSQYPKTRVYNNGNIANPVFTVSTPSLSGANWLGWCNSAGMVLYSSISNLALSETTVLYSGFKYPDSGPHTLTWTAASTKQGEEPNTSNVAGSPVINGNLYETAYIYDCNMTSVYVSGGHGSNNWTAAQARYYVGDNYVLLATATLESGVPHNSNWNGLSANIPIKKGFSGYLQLNITLTLGADWSRCYMGNAAYGARMILRGRTVIG